MTLVRKDSWTPDDDRLLADIILRHVREGSTQLRAFAEAAECMARTPAACGFRWNKVIRKQYDEDLKIAKKKRTQNKETPDSAVLPKQPEKPGVSYEDVIRFINSEKHRVRDLQDKIAELETELASRSRLIKELEEENRLLKEKGGDNSHTPIDAEDYNTFIQILNRARKILDTNAIGTHKNFERIG